MHLELFLWAAVIAPPAPADVVVEAPKPSEERVVCRTERVTGSRVVKQICKSAAQQRQEDLEASNKLRRGANNQVPEAFKRPTGE